MTVIYGLCKAGRLLWLIPLSIADMYLHVLLCESKGTYVIGFLMTLGVAVLYGFVLPSVELIYKKAKQTITYSLVIEMQIIISLSATILCVVGMVINNDFQVPI